MDIRYLEQFLALAQREHIASTADLLHISAPALSKNIAKLEREVGVKLFDRHGNYITLNDYGHTFSNYAANVVNMYQNGLLATKQIMYNTSGAVRIVCYAFCSILSEVVADYSFLNPSVEITVTHHVNQDRSALEDADLLLCAGEESQTFWENSGSWVSQDLFRERSYLLISRKYREYPEDRETLSILDVKDDMFAVMWESSFLFTDHAFQICQSAGFVPRVSLKTNNFLFKIGVVGEGRAVAVVPEYCVDTALRLYPDLRAFLIREADAERSVYLLRKKKVLASEAAQDLWDFILDHYGLEPDERD